MKLKNFLPPSFRRWIVSRLLDTGGSPETTRLQNEIDRSPRIPLKPIFKDSEGNQWYEFLNPLDIPGSRAVSAEVALRFAQMKLTEAELRRVFKQIRKVANTGDFVAAFGLMDEIEKRLDLIAEEKTLIDLGLAYSVMNDEDERRFDRASQEKKLAVLSRNEEVRAFFLEWAFALMGSYSAISPEDINEYLRQTTAEVTRLSRILPPNT